MVEKIGHVKNPLTVISIFAGVAEISGTLVLPFIESNNQMVYIWFLMLFPFSLIGLFFLTLNRNHKVLYAPSDYQNEENFVMHFKSQTIDEKRIRYIKELQESHCEEVIADVKVSNHEETSNRSVETNQENNNELESNAPKNKEKASDHSISKNLVISRLIAAQNLAIQKISSEIGKPFQSDMVITSHDGARFEFDAVSQDGYDIDLIEVKYSSNSRIDRRAIYSFMHKVRKLKQLGFNVKVYFALVTENDVDVKTVSLMNDLVEACGIDFNLYFYRYDDLVNNFAPGDLS